uniref:Uncharacterized protein n=1 Tax=Schlesneria paludicola TaxID=360056 RepID=A0A7C4QSE4_9PLAN
MPVKVKCPGCQKVLSAPDQARGKAIKCPSCETRVSIPAEPGGGTAAKKQAAKSAAPDSESALAALDLQSLEDKGARVCPKCGYDMSHYDEQTTECPECGYDMAIGGLGEKARKRQLKGPDPDKYYANLWGASWKFVAANQLLAWRTILYVLVASLLMFGSLFAYLRIPPWPPRLFFALCAAVCGLMIPGWLWFLDQEIVANTLMRKDKLKRVNLDFFLCSALGVKFVVWHVVFAGPLLAIPALIGWLSVQFGGAPPFVPAIIVGVCYLPVLSMLPIVVGHMVMPVQTPGWMFWKVVPAWLRVLKPACLWLALLLFTHLPAIGCVAAIAAVYGPALNQMALTLDHNSAIQRAKMEDESKSSKDPTKGKDPLLQQTPAPVDYTLLIVPGVLWVVACLSLGFPALYVMRINGLLVYYFRDLLDMVSLAKEYKYVARISREEEDETKPKTFSQVLSESAAVAAICLIIGAVFGMVAGSMTQMGMGPGIVTGALGGCGFGGLVGHLMLVGAAFKESVGWGLLVLLVPFGNVAFIIKFWNQGRGPLFTQVFAGVASGVVLVVALILGVSTGGPAPPAPGFEQFPPAGGAPQLPGQNLPGTEVLTNP